MSYTVKEIFLTAQGEGANIGRIAVFIRFAGCNLWSGRRKIAHPPFVSSAIQISLAARAIATPAGWPTQLSRYGLTRRTVWRF